MNKIQLDESFMKAAFQAVNISMKIFHSKEYGNQQYLNVILAIILSSILGISFLTYGVERQLRYQTNAKKGSIRWEERIHPFDYLGHMGTTDVLGTYKEI